MQRLSNKCNYLLSKPASVLVLPFHRWTFKLPEEASLSWVPKSGQVKKLLRVFHLCSVYSLFLAKTRILSLSFSLFSSSGSLQSSSNTPHITLSEFSLEAIFA